jgi:hypothetical protein
VFEPELEPRASFLLYRRRTRKKTSVTAAMRTTTPPMPPPMSATFDGPLESLSFSFAGSVESVEVDSGASVAVASAEVPCCDSTFADRVEEGVVKVPVPVVAVGMIVCIGSGREPVVARSFITEAAATVKTLESSLQQVLPSEAQQ